MGARSMPSADPPEPATSLPDAVVRALVADELDRVRFALEELGLRLCADPVIVRDHLVVLQSLDEIAQRNENLARTLRARDMVSEASGITLDSLKSRFLEAITDRLAEPAIDDADGHEENWRPI
jgi:hypothetical protein